MTSKDIAALRLHNQLIARSKHKHPASVVRWLGAVQCQDYLGSLWGIGLRQTHGTETAVERAIADKQILRTWPMRGTLHFVATEDARWMLKLLTPRVIARCATLYRQSELDDKIFLKSRKLFIGALQGGKQLTRPEMYEVLERAKISTAGQRGLHILGHLAQKGLLCFGARKGKQQTFALLDEWIPESKDLEREEALCELAMRYFTSHGPATLEDFTWWSGLSPADARTSLDMIKGQLVQEIVNATKYWFVQNILTSKNNSSGAYLLPAYDEYTVAYKDRSVVLDPAHATLAKNGIFNPVLILNGKVRGTWKRTLKKDQVVIDVTAFDKLSKSNTHIIKEAAAGYSQFVDVPVEISHSVT